MRHPPATMNFAVLADMANTGEDLECLTHWCADSAHKEQMMRLANFCHALCLVGEEQVDAYLPWIFEQVLIALRANPDSFDYRFNSEPLSFKYAVQDLKNNDKLISDFTFIVALRPDKSLEMLSHIDAMLTQEAGKKACASLVRVLKKKIYVPYVSRHAISPVLFAYPWLLLDTGRTPLFACRLESRV